MEEFKRIWRFLVVILVLFAITTTAHCQIYFSSYVYHSVDTAFSIEYDSCYTIGERPEINGDTLIIKWAAPDAYFPTTFIFRISTWHSRETHHYFSSTTSHARSVSYYGTADRDGVPFQITLYEHHSTFQLWVTPLKFSRMHNVDGRRGFYISNEKPGPSVPKCKEIN